MLVLPRDRPGSHPRCAGPLLPGSRLGLLVPLLQSETSSVGLCVDSNTTPSACRCQQKVNAEVGPLASTQPGSHRRRAGPLPPRSRLGTPRAAAAK
jgi:hypothetical protein